MTSLSELAKQAATCTKRAKRTVYGEGPVKHLKLEQSAKRTLHIAPNRTEIVACRTWRGAEFGAVLSALLAPLGATAGSALAVLSK